MACSSSCREAEAQDRLPAYAQHDLFPPTESNLFYHINDQRGTMLGALEWSSCCADLRHKRLTKGCGRSGTPRRSIQQEVPQKGFALQTTRKPLSRYLDESDAIRPKHLGVGNEAAVGRSPLNDHSRL
jgi:hypothetical protein